MANGLKQPNPSNLDPWLRHGLQAFAAPRLGTGSLTLVAAVFLSLLVGCTAPRPPLVISDPDPGVKIPAIKKAARKKDTKAVAQLVKELESDDSAVRFYAIRALHRLTGETFDYKYFASDEERKPAVEQWKKWLSGNGENAEKTDVAGSGD